MIVCTVPRDTNASPPCARTRSATASMSMSVASAVMTTTMWSNLLGRPDRTAREAETPGRPARGRWLLVAAGDYAGLGPTKRYQERYACCMSRAWWQTPAAPGKRPGPPTTIQLHGRLHGRPAGADRP